MRRRFLAASVAAALCGSSSAVLAGSFFVSPVRLELSAGRPVATVIVRNDDTVTTVVQLEVVSWGQNATEDLYNATPELLATPPIFSLPAGGKQVVRIGLRRAPDARQELSYRLFLQEIPPPLTADFQGMRMALRVGLPVFVAPVATARANLTWSAAATPDGAIKVGLVNNGSAHVKIANLQSTVLATSEASNVEQVSSYVLPGQSREWLLKGSAPVTAGSKIRLMAHTDSNAEIISALTLGAP
jgi:fimbrial chaperone protein